MLEAICVSGVLAKPLQSCSSPKSLEGSFILVGLVFKNSFPTAQETQRVSKAKTLQP
jgi:hypothetical protein